MASIVENVNIPSTSTSTDEKDRDAHLAQIAKLMQQIEMLKFALVNKGGKVIKKKELFENIDSPLNITPKNVGNASSNIFQRILDIHAELVEKYEQVEQISLSVSMNNVNQCILRNDTYINELHEQRLEYSMYQNAYRGIIKYYRIETSKTNIKLAFKRRLNDEFIIFFDKSLKHFETKLSKFKQLYTQLSSPKDKGIVIRKIFRCLTILGDLERYKAGALSLRTSLLDYRKSNTYYFQAIALNRYENDINPHLLLGTMANEKGRHLVAIYHYCRAITCRPPMISISRHPEKKVSQLKSAPLQNIRVFFKEIENNKTWNKSSPFASCTSLCNEVLLFHASVFSYLSYKKKPKQLNEEVATITPTFITSSLRQLRNNISRKIKLLVSQPSKKTMQTTSAIESASSLKSKLPPKLYIRIMFVTWFTIFEVSKLKSKRNNNGDNNSIVILMRRTFSPQVSSEKKEEILNVIRENAWTLYIDMISSYMINKNNTYPGERENFILGALPPLLLIGTSLFHKNKMAQDDNNANGVKTNVLPNFFMHCTPMSQRLLLNYIVTLHNFYIDDIVSNFNYDGEGDVMCKPKTIEEMELYGFPSLDNLEGYNLDVIHEDTVININKEIQPKLSGKNAFYYRVNKLHKFVQRLCDMKDVFINGTNCVCYIEQDKVYNSNVSSYTVLDICDSDAVANINDGQASDSLGMEVTIHKGRENAAVLNDGINDQQHSSNEHTYTGVAISKKMISRNSIGIRDAAEVDDDHDTSSISTSPSININSSPTSNSSPISNQNKVNNYILSNTKHSLGKNSYVTNTMQDNANDGASNRSKEWKHHIVHGAMMMVGNEEAALVNSPDSTNNISNAYHSHSNDSSIEVDNNYLPKQYGPYHDVDSHHYYDNNYDNNSKYDSNYYRYSDGHCEQSIFYDINSPPNRVNNKPPITYVSFLISSSGNLVFENDQPTIDEYVTSPFNREAFDYTSQITGTRLNKNNKLVPLSAVDAVLPLSLSQNHSQNSNNNITSDDDNDQQKKKDKITLSNVYNNYNDGVNRFTNMDTLSNGDKDALIDMDKRNILPKRKSNPSMSFPQSSASKKTRLYL